MFNDRSLPAPAAARTAQAPGKLSGRRPSLSPADQLERLSDRLDVLIQGVRIGATSHRQVDANIAEAEAIAAGLRAAFRGAAR